MDEVPLRLLTSDFAQDSSHTLTVGSLSIEFATLCVKICDRSIHLSSLEFNLLAYLAHNMGRVVPIAELLREVWDYCDSTGISHAQVKNCIKRLRGKIEPDPKRPRYVLTAYGHGYFMPAYVEAEQTGSVHITEFSEN